MLEVQNNRKVIVCSGVSGSGKSTFALRYLVNASLQYRFIFDKEGEYSQRLQMPLAGGQYEMDLGLCRGWVLFDPHVHFAGRLADAFNFFCDWAYQISERLPGEKLFVVDEAWRYVTARRYPAELSECVQSGRKRGLGCLFNTQNPDALHEVIRSECSELICFKLGEAFDWPKSKGFKMEEVAALPTLRFIARNVDSGGELRGAIKV
jgi:hypothetical protein